MRNFALRASRLLTAASVAALGFGVAARPAGALLALAVFGSGLATTSAATAAQPTPWPGGVWTPGEAVYGSKVDPQISVTMSDGVVLKADVSYPTNPSTGERAAGPFPVILTQTPYLGTPPTQGDYFVERGYIFVTMWVRGTTTSGGNFLFFSERDAKDGAEFVKWATKLPSADGSVGLWGGSYGGITQADTIAELGPNSPVKALAPYCMGSEFYREPYFAGGIPTQTLNFQRVIGKAMGDQVTASGQAFVTEVSAGRGRAFFNDFWKLRTPGDFVQKIADANVPALIWSSNNDIYPASSLELYAMLQNAYAKRPVYGPMAPDQKATGRYQIVIGQGGHCENIDQRVTLEWYDTWLKGAKTGLADTTLPMHVHELGSNRWLNTAVYPPVATYTPYYISAGNTLSATAPTAAGENKIKWAQPNTDSTLQYDSPVLTDGASLAGPISASLYASSDTANLELIATVQVIGSDGAVLPVSTGTVLASMSANDPDRSWGDSKGVIARPYGKYNADTPVAAGAINKYDFAISARFVAIAPGSKVRLILTTQAPTDKCSPPLGLDPCFPTAPQEASLKGNTTTVYYGADKTSSLNLPLLPASCWASTDNPGNSPYWTVDAEIATTPCQVKPKD